MLQKEAQDGFGMNKRHFVACLKQASTTYIQALLSIPLFSC